MFGARTFIAALVTFATLASPAIAAPPPPPPTLGAGSNFALYEMLNGEIEHLEGLCRPAGTTFTFSAAGIATGPYPGTFTETGTVTFGPASGTDLFNATVVAFESSFRIDAVLEGSPVEITGTKRLAFAGTGTAPTSRSATRFSRAASQSFRPRTRPGSGRSAACTSIAEEPMCGSSSSTSPRIRRWAKGASASSSSQQSDPRPRSQARVAATRTTSTFDPRNAPWR